MPVAAVDAKFTSVTPSLPARRKTPSQTITSFTIPATLCLNRVAIEPSRSKREECSNKQATAQVDKPMAARVASAVTTISSGSTQINKNAAMDKSKTNVESESIIMDDRIFLNFVQANFYLNFLLAYNLLNYAQYALDTDSLDSSNSILSAIRKLQRSQC